MSNVFIVDIANISEDNQTKNWDSLKHMSLILALEDEFDLKLPYINIIKWVLPLFMTLKLLV